MRLTRRVSVVVGSVVGGLTVVGAAWASGGSPTDPAVSPPALSTGTSWSGTVPPVADMTAWSGSVETAQSEPTTWSGPVETVPPVADPTAWSGSVELPDPTAAGPTSWSGPEQDAIPTDIEGSGEWIDVYEPVDLSGQLILHTRAGATVTPTDEGAVITTSEPQTITVPTAWTLLPVGDRFQLATVALTDGRPTCLTVTGPGEVGLEFCDAGRDAQLLQLTVSPTSSAGAPVEIRSEGGYLVVSDRGALTAGAAPTGTFLLSAVAVPR